MAWKITVLTIVLLMMKPAVFAADRLNGLANINYKNLKKYSDGEKTSTTEAFDQNYSLRFSKPITYSLSYRLNLRTKLTDQYITDSAGKTTSSYRRTIEPNITISLKNPLYTLDTGYLRRESWSTAGLKNDSRLTREHYFSRFLLSPVALPSLSLQFNRHNDYDYLDPREKDNTKTSYFISTNYSVPSRFFKFDTGISYNHRIDETPLSTINKTTGDRINGNYNFTYNTALWQNRSALSLIYNGNYSQNKTTQFISETGSVLFKRTTLGGFYATGTLAEPDVDILTSEVSLSDNDFKAGITNINLGTDNYHNLGVWISSEKSADRIYIYVNRDISDDTSLADPANWKIYSSDFNQPGTWTELSVSGVSVAGFDILDDIYRYEIELSAPRKASYFKAVNMATVSAAGITDVLVTEIEVYGVDEIPHTGETSAETSTFSQELGFIATYRPFTKLDFSLSYFIDKSDNNPDSAFSSVGNIFAYVLSRPSTEEDEDVTSNISRRYNASANWRIHRRLTTSFGFYRNETFDNKDSMDRSSNTYLMTLDYVPIPTVDTSLSVYRSDRYDFDVKETTNNSVVLSVTSRLYRHLYMINDITYSQSESFVDDTTSETYSLEGTIDARFTRKTSARLTYNYIETTSEGSSASTKSGNLKITHRPFRFVNITGEVEALESDGDVTHAEQLSVNWRPLPVISMNAKYIHKDPAGPETIDTVSSTWKWHITKFMNAQLRYSYYQRTVTTKSENYSLNAGLTVKF